MLRCTHLPDKSNPPIGRLASIVSSSELHKKSTCSEFHKIPKEICSIFKYLIDGGIGSRNNSDPWMPRDSTAHAVIYQSLFRVISMRTTCRAKEYWGSSPSHHERASGSTSLEVQTAGMLCGLFVLFQPTVWCQSGAHPRRGL